MIDRFIEERMHGRATGVKDDPESSRLQPAFRNLLFRITWSRSARFMLV